MRFPLIFFLHNVSLQVCCYVWDADVSHDLICQFTPTLGDLTSAAEGEGKVQTVVVPPPPRHTHTHTHTHHHHPLSYTHPEPQYSCTFTNSCTHTCAHTLVHICTPHTHCMYMYSIHPPTHPHTHTHTQHSWPIINPSKKAKQKI